MFSHTRARQRQDNDKTKVEPVHSYDAFHTRSDMSGVKGIIGMSLSLLVQVLNTFMTAYIHEKRSLARLICSPTIDY